MVAKYEGVTFDQLLVLGRAGVDNAGRAVWLCRCKCGKETVATSKQLTRGSKRACPACQNSGSKSPLPMRLNKYVVAPSGCWLWQGRSNKLGYGRIVVDGVETRAHRAMYFMLNPTADKSLVVRHRCDNPRCVNPDHLELGTQKDNMMDMHKRGRFRGGARPGNKNAAGNKGWMKGGVTAKYVAANLGDEVDVPDELV